MIVNAKPAKLAAVGGDDDEDMLDKAGSEAKRRSGPSGTRPQATHFTI